MKTYIVIPHYIVTEELVQLATDTIKSIRETYPEGIIISVNDGSPMNVGFLEQLSDHVVHNKKNSGFAISCNNGFKKALKLAKNDAYIVCANNDIRLNQGCIEALQEPFLMFDNVAITGIMSTKEDKVEGEPIETYEFRKMSDGGLLRDRMQDGGLWMSKKSVLKKIGLFDEQFIRGGYEDVDLFLRARDEYGMKLIMNGFKWYWHKQGATRWNCEKNGYINNFGRESKAIEIENLEKFIAKWGFNPHNASIWHENIIFNV